MKNIKESVRKIYTVHLTSDEEKKLTKLVKKGQTSARVITRGRILLMVHAGKTDKEIYQALSLADSTPGDIRERFTEGRLHRALYDNPRPGQKRKLTNSQEAQVTAIACSKAPKGHVRWTMDLLTEEVRIKIGVPIGRTAVYNVLLRSNTKPWLKKNVVYPESNAGVYRKNA